MLGRSSLDKTMVISCVNRFCPTSNFKLAMTSYAKYYKQGIGLPTRKSLLVVASVGEVLEEDYPEELKAYSTKLKIKDNIVFIKL